MQIIKSILFRPIAAQLSGAEIAAHVLSGSGILTLLLGIMIMPSLQLSLPGFYFALLSLVGFLILAHAAGQLTIIADELRRKRRST